MLFLLQEIPLHKSPASKPDLLFLFPLFWWMFKLVFDFVCLFVEAAASKKHPLVNGVLNQ